MRIQRQLSIHTARVLSLMEANGEIETTLAVSGLELKAARRWGQNLGLSDIQLQGGGSLGCRIKRQLLSARHSKLSTLFIGTDLPDLNAVDLRSAIAHLQTKDLVIGPTDDGGYWLIGFGPSLIYRPQHWPLVGIPWGKANVLDVTMTQAKHNGLRTASIAQRSDLDRLTDLSRWQG
ncbi:TIGR04282 family arsenosugar biosynthesis glycosyltransferase [Synechococcus sp. M16CYN]